ncbi:MAG: hypothetical protein AAF416_05605 [Pseudomonadota bacterium]
MSIVPTTYEEWEHCITVKCGVPLTAGYVAERIKALEDTGEYQTKKFIERWGEAHHAKVLAWFQQAEERLAQ